ncbi:hypothetical protein OT109_02995 [Phycisphaeraceae bacterium D3-23]
MEFTQPLANAVPAYEKGDVIGRARRLVMDRGWSSLANDTKWNQLITTMRVQKEWRPSYRYKSIDGLPSQWDVEWWYHLPFPFIYVQWFDIGCIEKKQSGTHVAAEYIDRSDWIENLLTEFGFDFKKSTDFYRIFGYYPRNMDLFE